MEQDKLQHRLTRFRLRTLLALVTISSIAAAWVAWNLDHRRQEHVAINQFEKQGGGVTYHSFFTAERNWLEKLGDKYFGDQARSVELRNSEAADLSTLSQMKELRCIALSFSRVSDISPLAELHDVDEIYLEGTDVEDLSPLRNLAKLEMLWLDSTPVMDLSPLHGLQNLKWLKLRDTRLTNQEVERLRAALPNCEIVYSKRKTTDTN